MSYLVSHDLHDIFDLLNFKGSLLTSVPIDVIILGLVGATNVLMHETVKKHICAIVI